jgi:hypothetical protein
MTEQCAWDISLGDNGTLIVTDKGSDEIVFTIIADEEDSEVRVYVGTTSSWPPIAIDTDGDLVHY